MGNKPVQTGKNDLVIPLKGQRGYCGYYCGAADRNRTGTTVARREILSLLRLPIPPQRHLCALIAIDVVNNIESRKIVKKKPEKSDNEHAEQERGTDERPSMKTRPSIERYCRDWAAFNSLLAITGVAAVGIENPCLVLLELENLRAEF